MITRLSDIIDIAIGTLIKELIIKYSGNDYTIDENYKAVEYAKRKRDHAIATNDTNELTLIVSDLHKRLQSIQKNRNKVNTK